MFNEMEYHLPVNTGLDAMEEVRHYIERHRRDVFFPFEARRTKADSGWLSPFQGEDRISMPCIAITKTHMSFYFPMLNQFSANMAGDRIGAS